MGLSNGRCYLGIVAGVGNLRCPELAGRRVPRPQQTDRDLAAGEPGKEILQPLAVVVLGGILTSTLLDQLVTPAVFYKFGRPIADRIIREREAHWAGCRNDFGEDRTREPGVPPFTEKVPQPVAGD